MEYLRAWHVMDGLLLTLDHHMVTVSSARHSRIFLFSDLLAVEPRKLIPKMKKSLQNNLWDEAHLRPVQSWAHPIQCFLWAGLMSAFPFKGLTVLGIRKEWCSILTQTKKIIQLIFFKKKKKKKAQTYFFVYIMRIISYLLYLISEN